MNFTRIIDSIISRTLAALFFALPLFFLPFTTDRFDFNKQMLLVGVTSLLLLAWIAKFILQKTVRLTITPLTLPLSLFTAITFASFLIQAPNRVEALMGRPATLLALFLLSLIATANLNTAKQLRHLLVGLTASAVVLSTLAVYQFFGLPLITFTPAGSPLALLTFLAPALGISVYSALKSASVTKAVWLVASAVIIFGAGVTAYQIMPGKPASPVLLPYSAAWAIAIDGFKSPRTASLGTGPDNFLAAFSQNRPASFNLTPNWNLRFTTGSNELLNLLATTGLLGLLAWIFILFTLFKLLFTPRSPASPAGGSSRSDGNAIAAAITIAFLIQLFLPANLVLLITGYWLLITYSLYLKLIDHPQVHDVVLRLFAAQVIRPDTSYAQVQRTIQNTEVLPWIVGVPVTAAILALWYFGLARVYAAERLFQQSLTALKNNQGTQTYNFQVEAIRANRFIARYHRAYATTNLVLANALSQQGQELSTQDRQNVTQLIQQAIREAKVAAGLNPQDPANWETLANIYRNLINVAAGSDNWAIAASAQAAQADPLNPRLRLDLGGVYYATGRYDEAIRAFQQATELKPDWANAYYNLAAAYQAKGDTKQALNQLQTVLRLVDPASADYQKALTEFQALQEKAGGPQPSPAPAQVSLQSPSPTPSPNPGFGNITLPESASPAGLINP